MYINYDSDSTKQDDVKMRNSEERKSILLALFVLSIIRCQEIQPSSTICSPSQLLCGENLCYDPSYQVCLNNSLCTYPCRLCNQQCLLENQIKLYNDVCYDSAIQQCINGIVVNDIPIWSFEQCEYQTAHCTQYTTKTLISIHPSTVSESSTKASSYASLIYIPSNYILNGFNDLNFSVVNFFFLRIMTCFLNF
mgnify:FL=1